MSTFDRPLPVAALDTATPEQLAPSWVPSEFDSETNEWTRLARQWRLVGLPPRLELVARDGIHKGDAFSHVKAVLGTDMTDRFAVAGYLMSLWFTAAEWR